MKASFLASLAFSAIIVPAVLGGTQSGNGSLSLFGATVPWTQWTVLQDGNPNPIINDASINPTGMVFHGGSLYVGTDSAQFDLAYAKYTPGTTGDLSVGSWVKSNAPANNIVQREAQARHLAINTSGSGFGAFVGSDPLLSVVGNSGVSSSHEWTYSTNTSPAVIGGFEAATLGASVVGPVSLEYAPGIDRFLVASSAANPANPIITLHPHDASGLLPATQTITLNNMPGLSALDVIGPAFASRLLGQPVQGDTILALFYDAFLQNGGVPTLAVIGFDGAVLGEADVPIAGLTDEFGTMSVKAEALAVDEANNLLYIGERFNGRIVVISINTANRCEGDVDASGAIDFNDLNLVLAHFGASGAPEDGDLDGDGAITFNDLNIVLTNFGNAC